MPHPRPPRLASRRPRHPRLARRRPHRPPRPRPHPLQDGHAHGSGRSIPGFHLLDALTAVHISSEDPSPVFTRFGGHAHAVGFSLPSARLSLLRERLARHAPPPLTSPLLSPALYYDAEVTLADLTPAFIEALTRCGPFGIGNPEPILLTLNLTLAAPVRIIQDKHVCLTLRHNNEETTANAIGWTRRTDWRRVCSSLALQPGSRVDIAYRLKEKPSPRFPGLDLELVDLRLVTPTT